MTFSIAHTTIDAHDSYALSEWWKQVLGWSDLPDDPNLPEHEECMIVDPEGEGRLLFIRVPDEELPAKRIHFDVRPRERTRDEEVAWLQTVGATVVDDQREVRGDGTGWVVMAEPEGNVFCVLRSQGELDASRG
jgi:predicted enzyme related to lactoylglutathione lyase